MTLSITTLAVSLVALGLSIASLVIKIRDREETEEAE